MSKLPFFNPYVEAAFDALETALLEAIRDTSSLAKAGAYAHMWSDVTAARERGREEMLNVLKKEKAPTVGAAGTETSICRKTDNSISHSAPEVKSTKPIISLDAQNEAQRTDLLALIEAFGLPINQFDIKITKERNT